MTSPFGPGEPSPDEVFRRITPPPGRARWPGLLTVLVRWRAELLLVGVVAALWYWAGGLAVGMVGLALAVLAAATLAHAADWPIDVFVPTWMTEGFALELDRLGANIHRCERRVADPAGDPAIRQSGNPAIRRSDNPAGPPDHRTA